MVPRPLKLGGPEQPAALEAPQWLHPGRTPNPLHCLKWLLPHCFLPQAPDSMVTPSPGPTPPLSLCESPRKGTGDRACSEAAACKARTSSQPLSPAPRAPSLLPEEAGARRFCAPAPHFSVQQTLDSSIPGQAPAAALRRPVARRCGSPTLRAENPTA